MEKTIEIPEGYEARIEGNKVILEPTVSKDSQKIRQEIKSMADSFKQVVFIADSYGNSYIKWDAESEESVIKLLEQATEYMKARVEQKPFLNKMNTSTMTGYKTSDDYRRLKELLDDGYEVVIIKDSHNEKIVTTAWRHLHFYHFGKTVYNYNDRFITDGCTFDEKCRSLDIEFIEPTEV